MTPVLAATQGCFGAIGQLRQLDPGTVSAPPALHQRLRTFIDEMRARLGAERMPAQDVADITYALAALADEVAVNQGEPLASYWTANLLQFHYFRENTAGEGFFARLAALRADGRRREVTRVYALCLLFGFRGKYRVHGGELELLTLADTVQREVLSGGEGSESARAHAREGGDHELSPHAERPPNTLGEARRNLPLVLAASGALVAALLLYLGQRLVLSHGVSAVEAEVAALPRP